jgi:hypothetical protein
MIPPNFATDNWRHYQNTVARNYIAAIKGNNIKKCGGIKQHRCPHG